MDSLAPDRSKSIAVPKRTVGTFLLNYVFQPIKSGIIGFSTFFTILILTKLLSYFIGTRDLFSVDIEDVLLSSIGFVLVFLIRLLENFKEK